MPGHADVDAIVVSGEVQSAPGAVAPPHAARASRLVFAALCALGLATAARAQGTVIPVTTNSGAALAAAITAANALAFQTSAANPVVVEFASHLIGQTISLTQVLPIVAVDHFTLRVAGAQPNSRVIVDASATSTAFRIASHHAAVRNVRFQNAGTPGSQEDVFTATGTDDLLLANCDFNAATGNALWLIGSTNTVIQDSGLASSAVALAATSGANSITVQRCTFTANQQGILFAIANLATIRDCVFDGNGHAVTLQPICNDVTFGPNNVVRNSTNLPAIVAAGAVGLEIVGNSFTDNRHAAIQLRDLCAFVGVTGNVLLRNGHQAGAYQFLIDSSAFVEIASLQCRDGWGGVHAASTHHLSILGNSTLPTSITGNDREGVVVTGCSDVLVDQATIDGNLRTVGGGQLAILGSSRVDVTASNISSATGGARTGVRVDASANVRVGQGSSILDNGGGGVFASNAPDLVLGNWTGAGGALALRGPSPLHAQDCVRVRLTGIPGTPCTVVAGTTAASLTADFVRCDALRIGPDVTIDGRHTTGTGLQIADSDAAVVMGTTIVGHTMHGFVATDAPALLLRTCLVDGNANGLAASGSGILLNPGTHGAVLWGNLVQRQQGNGFVVVDSNDAWLGPGNRAFDNGGDGILVIDNGTGALARHASLRSCAVVGRNNSGQTGIRAVHMKMSLANVTVTRNGGGIVLQLGTNATIVNSISHGNTTDRNKDSQSAGSWFHCLRGSTAGGTWTDSGVLTGVNPQFVAPASFDVRLAAGSPAIDSGLHATPAGTPVPCADAALGLRIRNAVIDRGAYEFVPAGGTGNSLDVAGAWLRGYQDSQLVFTVRATPAHSGQPFVLFLSGSGTGPSVTGPGGTPVPLVPDVFTGVLLSAPGASTGVLDGTGVGTLVLPIPPEVTPLLPELTFVAVVNAMAAPTNPVVVRFTQ